MKLNIGISFDGVICDSQSLMMRILRTPQYGINVSENDCNKIDLIEKHKLSQKEFSELELSVFEKDSGLFAEPFDKVVEIIEKISLAGHNLIIVTDRNEAGLKIAKKWLCEYKIDAPIISTDIDNREFNIAKEQRFNVFIDVRFYILQELKPIVPNRYLFSSKNNLNTETNGVAKRVSSWEGILKEIDLLALSH